MKILRHGLPAGRSWSRPGRHAHTWCRGIARPRSIRSPERLAGVIGMQTQLSPGWRRIAAFGLDYGFISPTWGSSPLSACLAALWSRRPPISPHRRAAWSPSS